MSWVSDNLGGLGVPQYLAGLGVSQQMSLPELLIRSGVPNGTLIDLTGPPSSREMTAEDLGLIQYDISEYVAWLNCVRGDAPYCFWLGKDHG